MSLCRLSFLSGFYSKDLIFEVMLMYGFNKFVYMIYSISVGLTVSYSFRLLYYLLVRDFNFTSMNMLSDEE